MSDTREMKENNSTDVKSETEDQYDEEDDQIGGGVGEGNANNSDEQEDDGINLEGEDIDGASEDPEVEAIKARVRDMEEEADRLKQMQEEVEKQMSMSAGGTAALSLEEKMEVDARSIFVGNVDYSATADDLERHFHGCGSVNRVTILTDKFTGHPKGFAYIEFADKESVTTAQALDESLFKGRQIKVTPKRTNRPGLSATGRSRGFGRGRGFRGGFTPRGFRGGFRPFFRGRGRGWGYSPY